MHYSPESLKSEGMLAVEITENDCQQPSVSAKLVALESILPFFVVLVRASVGVVGDDEDPAVLCHRRVVWWEGK